MKKISDSHDNDNPVVNAVFIGFYIAAIIILVIIMLRRVFPLFETLLAM